MKHTVKIFITLIISFAILNSCSKDNVDNASKYEDYAIVELENTSYFDLMILPKFRNDLLFVKRSGTNFNLPSELLYKNQNSDKELVIFYDSGGILNKVFVNGYTIIFDNFNNNFFDAAIISSSGDINIVRDVESQYNLSSNQSYIK